jgi:hypothetical protein
MRYGLRLLSTQWGFTLLAVATLAVGIASTTKVFGWVDGILRYPFPDVAAHRDEVFHVVGIANSQPARGEAVSANYFEVLGVRASLGRTFTAAECGDAPGACPVAVVSHAFWRDRLGTSTEATGKPLRVNRRQP